ncbi:hypothetical protein T4B_3476 [Trichinella pseudospiralis]|uniref:Uncharacterized protein n=1 Tax=Trichinella pseudospiralis TaxID=6337 RepID=A0A0V1GMS6_TRIPS|nr:hypothetical protein T4B_3476 [Trichinella pseudospiralis]
MLFTTLRTLRFQRDSGRAKTVSSALDMLFKGELEYNTKNKVTHRQRQPHTTEMTFNHGYNACLSLIGL